MHTPSWLTATEQASVLVSMFKMQDIAGNIGDMLKFKVQKY
jgi:hypothetical protein